MCLQLMNTVLNSLRDGGESLKVFSFTWQHFTGEIDLRTFKSRSVSMSLTVDREDNGDSSMSSSLEFSSVAVSAQNATFNSCKESLSNERNMENEVCRLNTYQKWPLKFINKESLAAAGFYYLNVSDHVECVNCNLVLGSFEEGDDPMRDHIRWSPDCAFVKTVNATKGNLHLTLGNPMEKVKRSNDTCGIFPLELHPFSYPEKGSPDKGLETRGSPKYTSQVSLQSRLKSFDEWPKSLVPRPKELAEAGFFYSGRSDETFCFYCGGGLKDWKSQDDPWVEHGKWYPECLHVLLNKGKDFIEKLALVKETMITCQEINNMNVDVDEQQLSNQVNQSLLISKPKEIGSQLFVQNSNVNSSCSGNSSPLLDEGQLCKVCFQEELGVVNLPCSHLVTCVKCAPSLKTCPVCRKPLTAVVRVFMK